MLKKYFPLQFILTSCLLLSIVENYNISNNVIALLLICNIALFSSISRKLVKCNTQLAFLFILAYTVIQGVFIESNLIRILQPIVLVVLYIVFLNYILLQKQLSSKLKKLLSFLIFLLPMLLYPFKQWGDGRIGGMMSNPNRTAFMAMFLSPIIVLVSVLTNKFKKLLLIMLYAVLLLTASRGALLAVSLSLVSYVIVVKYKRVTYMGLVVLTFFAFIISFYILDVFSFFLQQISFIQDVDSHLFEQSATGRDILKNIALKEFYASPYLGNGFSVGTYELDNGAILKSHNGYMDILTRMGIIGMIVYILFILLALLDVNKVKDKQLQGIALMPIIILVSISTNDSVFLSLNHFFFYIIFVLGCILNLNNNESSTYNK